MPVPEELVELLKNYELRLRKGKSSLKAYHQSLPIMLVYRFRKKSVVIELGYEEELREYFEDLAEEGEDMEDYVDDVLSELRDIAIESSRLLEEKGYSVELRLREGENDIKDLLEEVLEEYVEYEYEEE